MLTRLNELNFGKALERVRLVQEHPKAVSEALAKLDEAVAQGETKGRPVLNPAGLLRTLLEGLIGPGVNGLISGLARSMTGRSGSNLAARNKEIRRQAAMLRNQKK